MVLQFLPEHHNTLAAVKAIAPSRSQTCNHEKASLHCHTVASPKNLYDAHLHEVGCLLGMGSTEVT